VTPEDVAEIVTVPAFLPCASPDPRMDANCGFEDFHEILVKLAVLPSLKFPTALKSTEVCAATRALVGFTVIDTSLTVETVSGVDCVMPPQVADIVTAPVALLLTSPAALMDAKEPLELDQSTESVKSCVLLSLNVPVAVNCFVAPIGMLEFNGASARDTRVALVTVTFAEPEIPPEAAVIVDDPVPTEFARPFVSTVSTAGAEDVHWTEGSNCVLPSSKIPVAEKC